MKPIKDYKDFLKDIDNNRDNRVVGFLVANADKTIVKDHIIADLELLNIKTDKYIDLYLPGWSSTPGENKVSLKGKQFYFSMEDFNDFILMMESANINYTFMPMLVLVQVNEDTVRTDFSNLKKIVIRLDDAVSKDLSRFGMYIEQLINIAKANEFIELFGKDLLKKSEREQLREKLSKLFGTAVNFVPGLSACGGIAGETGQTLIQFEVNYNMYKVQ